MPVDLTRFDLLAMLRCRRLMAAAVRGAPTQEAAARQLCQTLYDELRDSEGRRACALVRCYKTHAFGKLEPGLKRYVERPVTGVTDPRPEMKCLTLLATVGDERRWNSRHLSEGHRAIPLPSPSIVERAPMIAQLIRQFGLDLSDVIAPSAGLLRDLEGKTYGVFHVEDASGSPFIPAQEEFVTPYGIRSAVGFGGPLSRGELFAVILFTRVAVSQAAADRFRALALDVKSCFHTYRESEIFDPPSADDPGREARELAR